MVARIAKDADLARLLLGWSRYLKGNGQTGAALVLRKSAEEIQRLRAMLLECEGQVLTHAMDGCKRCKKFQPELQRVIDQFRAVK